MIQKMHWFVYIRRESGLTGKKVRVGVPPGYYGVPEMSNSCVLSLLIVKVGEFCHSSLEWGADIKM